MPPRKMSKIGYKHTFNPLLTLYFFDRKHLEQDVTTRITTPSHLLFIIRSKQSQKFYVSCFWRSSLFFESSECFGALQNPDQLSAQRKVKLRLRGHQNNWGNTRFVFKKFAFKSMQGKFLLLALLCSVSRHLNPSQSIKGRLHCRNMNDYPREGE